MPLPAQIQLANTFGNWVDATNDIIVTAGNSSHYILVSQNATPTVSTGNISVNGVMTLATLKANGGIGTNGQFLTSNGSTIHWSTLSVVDANSSTSGLVNTSVQTFTGNKTFADNVAVTGSITVNALSANGGLGTAGQFLTSNATVAYWSTLSVVDANSSTSGLVNTASQSFTGDKTFTGAVNASSTLGVIGAATLSNTLAVTGDLTLSKGISANGGFGTAGQFLTSNATVAYWSTLSVVDANSSTSGLVNTSTQTFSGSKTFGNDVGISGNLTVSGTTTYINTTNLQIGDNIIALNADLTAITAPTESAGIEINRGSSANTYFQWNETNDVWQVTTDGTNYGTLIDTRSTTGINASALSTGTVPLARFTSANTTANGIVDTTTQSFAGDKTFTGAVTASSTLGVTGAATLSNTLAVTGAATLSNTLAVTGNLTLSKGISANGGFGTAGQFLTSNATVAYWSTLSVVDANSTTSGLVNTAAQSFAGAKSFTGATTLTTSIFNANTSTGMTANGKLTLNTTNGRFVLPVGSDLWAL